MTTLNLRQDAFALLPYILLATLQLLTPSVKKWAEETFDSKFINDQIITSYRQQVVEMTVAIFNHFYFAIALISALATSIAGANSVDILESCVSSVLIVVVLAIWIFKWRPSLKKNDISVDKKMNVVSYLIIIILATMAVTAANRVPVNTTVPVQTQTPATAR